MTDDEQDVELTAMLRRHAEELTGPIDTEAALADVRRRGAGRRRRLRVTSATLAVAAAAVAVIAAAAVVGDDRQSVRTPAADTVATGVTSTSNGPATPTSATTPPTTAAPATTATVMASSTEPPAPQIEPSAPATTAPTTPAVARYDSAGGSITVRAANGVVSLDGAPVPTAGWTYRIDDDGPDRVRVRFERDSERSEIRVELVSGQLIPEIVES